MRKKLLARARLAKKQHRGVGDSDAPHLALHLCDRGTAANETCEGILRTPLGRQSAPSVLEFALQIDKLADQRLHCPIRLISEHQRHPANHVALLVAQGQPADEEGAILVGQQIDDHRCACVNHLAHERVGHDFLDPSAEDAGVCERPERDEASVALVEPDDAVLSVQHDHSHHRFGKRGKHALRGELEHTARVERVSGVEIGRHGVRQV